MPPQDNDSFAPLLDKGDLPFHVEAVAVDVDEDVYGDQRLPTTITTVAHGGTHGEAAATHPSDTSQDTPRGRRRHKKKVLFSLP
jgi:hypothetical protein